MRNILLAGFAAVAFAGAAHAVTITSSPFDVNPAPGETTVLDFESDTLPAGYTITGSGFDYYTGSTPNLVAAPAGDATRYLAVRSGGTATISFPANLTSFSLYIGSVDDFNSITFDLAEGPDQTFTGSDWATTPDGNQASGETNRRYFFAGEGGERITGITLASSNFSFEVDNLAVTAVPEPATWAMMIGGLGLVGAAQRRRRRSASVIA